MAESYFDVINDPCNSDTALNYVQNKTERIGHITTLEFKAGDKLKADWTVKNPIDQSELKVIATIDHISWTGNPTDPIEVSARLSSQNKGILKGALAKPNASAELTATIDVYEYDYGTTKFFKSFHTEGTPLKLNIKKGSKVRINPEPSKDIEKPVNFSFNIKLTGNEEAQPVNYAALTDIKTVLTIGTKVG